MRPGSDFTAGREGEDRARRSNGKKRGARSSGREDNQFNLEKIDYQAAGLHRQRNETGNCVTDMHRK